MVSFSPMFSALSALWLPHAAAMQSWQIQKNANVCLLMMFMMIFLRLSHRKDKNYSTFLLTLHVQIEFEKQKIT